MEWFGSDPGKGDKPIADSKEHGIQASHLNQLAPKVAGSERDLTGI